MRKIIGMQSAWLVIACAVACSDDDGEEKKVLSVWSGASYEDAELTIQKGEIEEMILYTDGSLQIRNLSYEDTPSNPSDDVETVSQGDYVLDGTDFVGEASTIYEGVEYAVGFEGTMETRVIVV